MAKCSGLLKSKLETETVVELLQLNTSEAAAATGAMDHRHLVQKKTPLQVQVQVGDSSSKGIMTSLTHSTFSGFFSFLFFFFPNFYTSFFGKFNKKEEEEKKQN